MAEHEAMEQEQSYEAPTLEALGTVEDYTTQGTDISIVVEIG